MLEDRECAGKDPGIHHFFSCDRHELYQFQACWRIENARERSWQRPVRMQVISPAPAMTLTPKKLSAPLNPLRDSLYSNPGTSSKNNPRAIEGASLGLRGVQLTINVNNGACISGNWNGCCRCTQKVISRLVASLRTSSKLSLPVLPVL